MREALAMDTEVSEYLLKSVRHLEPSLILSLDDDISHASGFIMDLAIKAILEARSIQLEDVALRFTQEKARYINLWPGEQYKLLAALVSILKPQLIVEIGTAAGGSCLTMKKFLSNNGRIITYDLIPWDQYPNTGLKKYDFDERLEQRIRDLSKEETDPAEIETIEKAEFIFVDAAKDGIMEQRFCDLFDRVSFKKRPIMFFDDIRLLNMVEIWRKIKWPKLDVTSFGHWSGSGLVEWGSETK
jgi:predicted O-methyltransferase YrrM